MKLSRREMTLGVMTLAAALFGVSAVMVRPRIDEIRRLRGEQQALRDEIERDRRLVEQKARWQAQYGRLSGLLPSFPEDKRMDVHWLSVMDRLASRHELTIRRHEAGRERKIGDVYELPIECHDWEGTLEALTFFLFDLQKEGAMLDIRQLLVKPNPRDKNLLRGRFSLYCAYTKPPSEPGS